MEALAISAANLDVIEKNLGSVADELSGVINNVNTVNSQVNNVEKKVGALNDEVKNLVKEIRETTTITNARQNIMYNNEQIEKKYGYYDKVRRTTESLLDSIENSEIEASALINLKQELLMNNPNYWLSNALAALCSWILDDKEGTEKELNNALKKDDIKTSIFFSLVNLKLGRNEASINWLKTYLSKIDPISISSEFVTVLDLISNGLYGTEGKQIIINKIKDWMNILVTNKLISESELNKWTNFILTKEKYEYNFPYLTEYSNDINVVRNNLLVTSSYENMYNYLEYVTGLNNEEKTLDNVISDLIYEYEKKEQIFQKDNLKNRLIIECNGDRDKAEELYKKQEEIYDNKVNFISLLSNIVIYKDEYKVTNETQKFALSLIKNNIINAYENINSKLTDPIINVNIDNFVTKIDINNKTQIENDVITYLNKTYSHDDKFLVTLLIAINIGGVLGIFVTLGSALMTIILIIMGLADIYIIFKIIDHAKLIEKTKARQKEILEDAVERIYAETVDYKNAYENGKNSYDKLKQYLENINIVNYMKSNGERNIDIGE